MSSRMYAPHTTCPGATRRSSSKSLSRKCPSLRLRVGEDAEEDEIDIDEITGKITSPGSSFHITCSVGSMHSARARTRSLRTLEVFNEGPIDKSVFYIEVSLGIFDYLRPRRCKKCGALYIRGGKKILRGDLKKTIFEYLYLCPRCATRQ